MRSMRHGERALATVVLAALLATTTPCVATEDAARRPFRGADLSYVPRLIAAGAEYRAGGDCAPPLKIFSDNGYGIVRLRLWLSPPEPWHGTQATLAFASEASAAGFDLMLDIHYSDTWADPGHQTKPVAWEKLGHSALVDSVRAYTARVMRCFREAGATPSYVQIGNEVSAGMLWDDGRVGWQGSEWDTPERWSRFAELLSAGAEAARAGLPPDEKPEIVIHFDDGADNGGCRWFYDNVEARGVDYDIIGLSFYPWWHGTLSQLEANVRDLAARYGKPVVIVEAAYPWTLDWHDGTHNFVGDAGDLHAGYPATPEGQKRYLDDLFAIIEAVPRGLGAGVCYWEPAFVPVQNGPPNPYENLTLFDFDRDALPALSFGSP